MMLSVHGIHCKKSYKEKQIDNTNKKNMQLLSGSHIIITMLIKIKFKEKQIDNTNKKNMQLLSDSHIIITILIKIKIYNY